MKFQKGDKVIYIGTDKVNRMFFNDKTYGIIFDDVIGNTATVKWYVQNTTVCINTSVMHMSDVKLHPKMHRNKVIENLLEE